MKLKYIVVIYIGKYMQEKYNTIKFYIGKYEQGAARIPATSAPTAKRTDTCRYHQFGPHEASISKQTIGPEEPNTLQGHSAHRGESTWAGAHCTPFFSAGPYFYALLKFLLLIFVLIKFYSSHNNPIPTIYFVFVLHFSLHRRMIATCYKYFYNQQSLMIFHIQQF